MNTLPEEVSSLPRCAPSLGPRRAWAGIFVVTYVSPLKRSKRIGSGDQAISRFIQVSFRIQNNSHRNDVQDSRKDLRLKGHKSISFYISGYASSVGLSFNFIARQCPPTNNLSERALNQIARVGVSLHSFIIMSSQPSSQEPLPDDTRPIAQQKQMPIYREHGVAQDAGAKSSLEMPEA
jgi:hypothetical protein